MGWADGGDQMCVKATDFDAEHALRLEAERQVGELREQVAKLNEEAKFCDKVAQGIEDGLRTKLETAIGLLRQWDGMWNGGGIHNGPLTNLRNKTATILNTTSTEGKDHE